MTREDYIEELIGLPDNDTIDISKIVYGLYSGLQESIYEWSIYVIAVLVYDYICSTQFVHRLKAVVDHQEQMKIELDKERNAMQRIWKKREGQITGITSQMMSICGELQGLSNGDMPMLDEIAALE